MNKVKELLLKAKWLFAVVGSIYLLLLLVDLYDDESTKFLAPLLFLLIFAFYIFRNYESLNKDNKIVAAFVCVALIALSGYWNFQGKFSEQWARERAMRHATDLVGMGRCGEIKDISTQSGGWPCVYIASASTFIFDKVKQSDVFGDEGPHNRVCFDVTLNVERGLPGQEYFYINTDYSEVCVKDSGIYGWTDSGFERAVRNQVLKSKVDTLTKDLCEKFYYQLTDSDRQFYCKI